MPASAVASPRPTTRIIVGPDSERRSQQARLAPFSSQLLRVDQSLDPPPREFIDRGQSWRQATVFGQSNDKHVRFLLGGLEAVLRAGEGSGMLSNMRSIFIGLGKELGLSSSLV